jgi:hypothetical protein
MLRTERVNGRYVEIRYVADDYTREVSVLGLLQMMCTHPVEGCYYRPIWNSEGTPVGYSLVILVPGDE